MSPERVAQPWLTDLAIGFSLVNLWLLPMWNRLLLFTPVSAASLTGEPAAAPYLAALLVIVIGTICFTAIAALIRFAQRPVITTAAKAGLIGAVVLLTPWIYSIPALLLLLVIAVVRRRNALSFTFQATRIAVLLGVPFALGIVLQFAWKAGQASLFEPGFAPALSTGARPPRAVIMVFDGLDNRVLLDNDSGFVAPAFAALAEQAFVPVAALSPTTFTRLSLPTLIQGERIVRVRDEVFPQMRVWRADSAAAVPWREATPNLFSVARARGLNVGIAGWYLSYCDVFRSFVVECYSYSYYGVPGHGRVLPTAIELVRANLDIDASVARAQAQRHVAISQRAAELAADARLDLVFVHLSLPHAPWIAEAHGSGYLGNVMAADQTMARVRSAMEAAGLWEEALIIVTSDHGLSLPNDAHVALGFVRPPAGTSGYQVPFLVKLPGQRQRHDYAPEFNTMVLRAVVEDVQAGRIATAEQLANRITEMQRALAAKKAD